MSRTLNMVEGREAGRTRQKILDVALRLFATRGYAGASTQDIAQAAGVAKPALYYHFGSKAGLFRAIVDRTEDELFKLILAIKAETSDVREQLVKICAVMFQFACDRPALMGLAIDLWLDAKEQGPARKHCLGKIRERLAAIGEIMERGRSEGKLRKTYGSQELAVGFLSLLHFHILLHLAHPETPLTRRMAARTVSLFLEGAGHKPLPCPAR